MQTEDAGMRKYREIVTANPIRPPSIRARVLIGAIVAAGLLTAAVANGRAARPDGAVSVAGDAGETVVPPARVERSGSLAVYPLLY